MNKRNNLYLNSDNLNKIAIDDFERSCKTLELDKVLEKVAEYAATEGARERISALRPSVSIENKRDAKAGI